MRRNLKRVDIASMTPEQRIERIAEEHRRLMRLQRAIETMQVVGLVLVTLVVGLLFWYALFNGYCP